MIPHSLVLSSQTTDQLIHILNEIHFTYERFENLSDVMLQLKNQKFHFLILSIEDLNDLNSQEILENITKSFPNTLIILITNTNHWAQTASLLKRHSAYDYLQTPLEVEHVKFTLDRSFQYLNTKLKSQFIHEAENHLFKRVIEIFDWKKSLIHKENQNISADIIHQMNISLFQGSGIGTLMSVVSILISKSKLDTENNHYIVQKPILDLLSENYEAAKSMFDSMSISQSVIDDDLLVENTESPNQLVPIFETEIKYLEEALVIKSQKINISQIPNSVMNYKIRFNPEKITYIVREILLNAIKYSKEGDEIFIIYFHRENFLEIKVINPAYQNEDGTIGIPEKYESFIFEPFFRISSVVDDSYAKFEQFRFGLGLTLVKKIMDQHQANIQIYNIDDNLRNDNTKDVCLTMRFPLLQEEK
ncbi:Two component response regulator [Leptospira biflexa serovar Patoc strain 'Patoc 1 (Ames)']|uniref:histidine kinase n=1 Tax=Leptospira biflexa serovar Patoc (strain Patoc 1 / ATCC 23582 / Paris) TaxID=456481 RepID=B0SLZ0_LEPBP|nr:ATP-binding protein [Leptospira biflexa]ABZ93416.1 Two component response regulator [Leptospira biflexa serovar Patoc strain 'Patoc 1 (Ames)']ABZ97042.1 Putative chemotactic two-component histidine kinase with CheY motif [Leptospira biflexa serovar Patoc strain 'Patoc 1 (Paris)']